MSEGKLKVKELDWELIGGNYYAFALGLGYTTGRVRDEYIAYKSKKYSDKPIISQVFATMKEAMTWCQIDLDMEIKGMVTINSRKRYTDWHVLLKEEDGKWFSIACIDPDDEKWADEEIPSFDVIMRIPDPTTIDDFEGF